VGEMAQAKRLLDLVGDPMVISVGISTCPHPDVRRREDLFARARSLETYWEDAVHMLRQSPNVADVRNIGLVGGIELTPLEGRPGARGSDVYRRAFDGGLLVRVTGDTIALSPPLIISKPQIYEIVEKLGRAISDSSKELA